MFIITLPPVTNTKSIEQMFLDPLIEGARYNVGTRSPFSPEDTLKRFIAANPTRKPFWIDLKGRQLRITQWADPTYGDIVLNHHFSVDLPAKVIFRGGHESTIVNVKDNRIYVDPSPQEALGAGQAINVIGSNLQIKGFLTDQDIEYIKASAKLGLHQYMLSFVEQESDLTDVMELDPEAQLVLKIESLLGLTFIKQLDMTKWTNVHLMLARDDLMVNIGDNKANILTAAKRVLDKDPDAIAASHLFTSLVHGSVTAADFSDLAYLSGIGYRHFMLSDTVSHFHLTKALDAWENFLIWQSQS